VKGLHWYIARHYLGAGRKGLLSLITWIALGGVTVGVTALVVVMAVMAGMQGDLRAKILESTPHVMVLEQGSSLRLTHWKSVLDTILSVPNVVGAAPFVLTEVSLVRRGGDGEDYSQSSELYGISLDTTRGAPTQMERKIIQGALDLKPPPSGLPPLLVGSGLANRMGLFKGDTVVVVAYENLKRDIMGGLTPTLRQFQVTGTFTTGMYDYDTHNTYTTLSAAQELLGIEKSDQVSGIGVRTVDPDEATAVGDTIQAKLGLPYYVESWITTNRELFAALKLEKLAMGLILFLIVVVAAFNIVSTLVMVVADRTREIGILKAMGMTRKGILGVFVLQGAWIGIIGTGAGTIFGVTLSWVLDHYQLIKIPPEVYFVDHLPVTLQWTDVSSIVAASVVVAFAATIYPAFRASRLEPVDAIRHE